MSKTTETGHAKNVANLNELISFVTAYGATYNPPKASLKLTALKTLLTSSQNSIELVNSSIPPYKSAITAREAVFEPLSKFVTRIINTLEITDAPPHLVDNAKTIVRKIRGERTNKIDPDNPDEKHVSVSQMSFDNRLANFNMLIKLLQEIPEYKPNEKDLQLTALIAMAKDMNTKNNDVLLASTNLSNARIERNKILYSENTGLYDIAQDAKKYIKVIFGTSSPEYKQVRSLSFTSY